jgi:hypothetical protein
MLGKSSTTENILKPINSLYVKEKIEAGNTKESQSWGCS